MNLPSGTVTFLFTDIEGSTKLAQEHPDEMPALLARHNEILSQAVCEKISDQRPPVEQGSVDKDLEVIKSQLTEKEFAESSANGRTMTTEQAIALALEE